MKKKVCRYIHSCGILFPFPHFSSRCIFVYLYIFPFRTSTSGSQLMYEQSRINAKRAIEARRLAEQNQLAEKGTPIVPSALNWKLSSSNLSSSASSSTSLLDLHPPAIPSGTRINALVKEARI